MRWKRLFFFLALLAAVTSAVFVPVCAEGEETGEETSAPQEQEGNVDIGLEMPSGTETAEGREKADNPSEGEVEEVKYYRGRVTRITVEEEKRETEYSGGSLDTMVQVVEALVLGGPHKGEKVSAVYELTYGFSDKYKSVLLKEGDEVLLYIDEDENGTITGAYVTDVARDRYLAYLLVGFCAILLIVGRTKGLKAIISLLLSALAIIYVLLPSILKGWDPVIVSVAICVAVIGITMLLISGFNRKTLAAIIGTTGGVVVSGILAILIGTAAKLTGFGDDESQMLMYIPQNIYFDFRGLLFSGIIIGTMGATMDVGMSIASAMYEIKFNTPDIKIPDLIKAGMNVGRDVMATMTNTLILAYSGGSLNLMLLLMAYNIPFTEIINRDIIASEIVRALAGSIGLILTIPITAFAAGAIEKSGIKAKRPYGMDY